MANKRYLFFSLLFVVLFLPIALQAQSFNAGVRNYDQQDYEQAAAIFSQLNSPQAKLFAAKSNYALGNFDKAENILNDLLSNSARRIYYEAAYTSALVDFQQKQYTSALVKLYTVFNNSSTETLSSDAQELYNQLLNYLSVKQRVSAIKRTDLTQVQYQLVESALGRADFSAIKKLISAFYESADEGKWYQKIKQLESSLSSEAAYKIEYGGKDYEATPPDGTIYNIAIALPKVSTKKPVYSVVRGLYLGAQLAVEQFNDQHSDVKSYLTFLSTKSGDLEDMVKSFTQNQYGDIIIGPLFSEQAKEMIPLSAEYSVPIIAPLATSNLESDKSLFYQANSTFDVHGKKMAAFAVKELGFNTFAVIAGQNTSGAKSARAFRKKAENLRAKVVLFQLKDFKEKKDSITAYIKENTSKLASVDAIYAPFTSDFTSYLVERLVYAVNTFENPVTLLGSQKWKDINFSSDVYARSPIYYSVNTFKSSDLNNFQRSYRQSFSVTPNTYSVIGYDITHYVLQLLNKVGNPAELDKAIRNAEFYRGLLKNIYFNKKHVNQAIQILKVSGQGYRNLQRWHPE